MADSTTRTQLEEVFNYTKGLNTTPEKQTAVLNKQADAAYAKQKLETNQAQNQFVQNQAQNQLSALDAIRRSNASAIANGANAGLQAANELSAILGLQDTTAQAATDLANTDIENAAAYNKQLNANAVAGLEAANELNATNASNMAELAKSIATVEAAELEKEAQDNATKVTADKVNTENALAFIASYSDTVDKSPLSSTEKAKIKNYITNAYLSSDSDKISKINAVLPNLISGDYSDLGPTFLNFLKDMGFTVPSSSSSTTSSNDKGTCLLPGTLVTTANGLTKPIEKITEEDLVMAWCSHTGRLRTAKVLLAEKNKAARCVVTTLDFADKTSISLVTEHGFFDATLCKYVYIHDAKDAKRYVGHKFLKLVNGKHKKVKLKKAYDEVKITETYSPCSARELCIYANGFLSMPGATEPFVNIFKYDNNATYKKHNRNRLIKKIGLFTPEDLGHFVPEDIFHAFQGEYLKIKIAKNKLSLSDLQILMKKYSKYFIKE